MARKHRNSSLESRTARLRLSPRGKPYPGPLLARGIRQDYRRNKTGNGSWIARSANGHGKYWTKVIAEADDYDESNTTTVLTFFEAQKPIKQLARGEDGSADGAPLTLEGALVDYRADLIVGLSNPYNADWPLLHLTDALKARPVALLTSKELKVWRDGLLSTMAPSTINRLCGCLRAALNLAGRHDRRLLNREVWEIGLVNLPNAQQARNVILTDDTVREFVASAYAVDDKFGLFTDTLAITGARPSQARRLRVEDLHDHPVRPKLMMPRAGKGGGRNRSAKKLERFSLPITAELATRLKAAARGRAADAPLLLQADGTPWADNPGAGYHNDVKKIVASIGADGKTTMYSLRHSSIVRMLKVSVPIRIVASLHDTSVRMIEAHYSRFITEGSDDISRHALLHHQPAAGNNVLALTR
jgi:integrase